MIKVLIAACYCMGFAGMWMKSGLADALIFGGLMGLVVVILIAISRETKR